MGSSSATIGEAQVASIETSFVDILVDEVLIWDQALTEEQIKRQFVEYSQISLINDVLALGLPQGIENDLALKLKNALQSLEKEHDRVSINQLSAFIHKIETQRRKKILIGDAKYLIGEVQAIIDLLHGGE